MPSRSTKPSRSTSGCGSPTSNPTLSHSAANCGGAFCHNPCGANNGGGLCLQSHTTLMQGGVVIPGDSAGSALVQRLDGRLTPRMPYGRAPLADTLIQLVRIWIAEGALDN